MTRSCTALIAAAALAIGAGCSTFCTAELRSAVHGTITHPDGTPAIPDAVLSIKGGVEERCEFFDDQYYCYERGAGEYSVRVIIGSQNWTFRTDVDDERGGCHVEPVQLDLILGTP